MPAVSRLTRFFVFLSLILVIGFSACRLVMPEGFVVNAPIMNSLLGWGVDSPDAETVERQIRVAEGFGVGVWAELPQVRFLRPTPTGDLLASVPRQGKVVLLQADRDGDGRSDGQRDLLTEMDRPHGLELHDGFLYVAEGNRITRLAFDAETGTVSGEPKVIVSDLPDGENHWTKTVRIGPDGAMYVTVGSSCNVCEEEDERRAAMLRFPITGGEGVIFARGLRNAVGFDWQPGTGHLFATDNGRDLLGDDFPPCELNLVVEGGDYGWPYANGDSIADPDFGPGNEARVAASKPPAHGFGPHNAPLGMVFLSEEMPGDYSGAALAALHGSWNRTEKDGYKVVSLHWGPDGSVTERDFLAGFLEDDDVIGRPVDVAQANSGEIYISDDYSGTIYRVTSGEAEAALSVKDTAAKAGDPLADLPLEARVAGIGAGKALYERFDCATCHEAERAEAGVVVFPLRDLAARHDLEGLTSFLAAPTPPMPAFPMTDSERRDLSIYLLDAHP